jgi:hypothetical protein
VLCVLYVCFVLRIFYHDSPDFIDELFDILVFCMIWIASDSI